MSVHLGMRRSGYLGTLGVITVAAALGQSGEALELNEKGLAAANRGDQAGAERLYRQSIAVWRKLGAGYEAHLGTTEFNLGQALCAMGRRTEAKAELEEAVTLLRGSLGVRYLNTLSAINYLGGLELMVGDSARAEALFNEVLPVERALYPKDKQMALTLGGLSSIRIRAGKIAEALPLAEEGLTLALAVDGELSIYGALAYANVAAVHKWAGRYERALPLYRKSLSIYEKLLGPEHPRVASILGEIGLLEMQEGNFTLAERDMQRSLDIVRRPPGWAFEEWIGESNLGTLRYRQGKFNDAARLLAHSLSMQEQAGIHGGLDLAVTLDTLARVREKQRRFEDAKQLRERAVMVSSFQ